MSDSSEFICIYTKAGICDLSHSFNLQLMELLFAKVKNRKEKYYTVHDVFLLKQRVNLAQCQWLSFLLLMENARGTYHIFIVVEK